MILLKNDKVIDFLTSLPFLFQKKNVESLKLKFQTVADKKMAKNFRGLLYFAAPGMCEVNDQRVSFHSHTQFGKLLFSLLKYFT